jgi:hypothetical protein
MARMVNCFLVIVIVLVFDVVYSAEVIKVEISPVRKQDKWTCIDIKGNGLKDFKGTDPLNYKVTIELNEPVKDQNYQDFYVWFYDIKNRNNPEPLIPANLKIRISYGGVDGTGYVIFQGGDKSVFKTIGHHPIRGQIINGVNGDTGKDAIHVYSLFYKDNIGPVIYQMPTLKMKS